MGGCNDTGNISDSLIDQFMDYILSDFVGRVAQSL